MYVSLQKANTQGGEAKHWESSSTRGKHDKKEQQSPDVKKETQEQKEEGEQEANNDELHKQQNIKNSDHRSDDDEIVNTMNQQSLSHRFTKTQAHNQNQLMIVDLATATSKPTEGQFIDVTSRRQQRKAKNAKSMNNCCSKKDLSANFKDKTGRDNGDIHCPHAHNPRFQQTRQGQ